jgi:hypothetical protein
VPSDVLQHQHATFALVAGEREQQPIAPVQPWPVELVADLLDVGGTETVGGAALGQLRVPRDFRRVQAAIDKGLQRLRKQGGNRQGRFARGKRYPGFGFFG